MIEWIVLEILVEVGKKQEKISYKELAETVNYKIGRVVIPVNRTGLSAVLPATLRKVCTYVYEIAETLPGSVVVSKSTGKPGKGYFKFLNEIKPSSNWEKEVKRFYKLAKENKWG